MPSLTYEVEIAAPPERVFDFLADFRNDTRWRSNVIEMVARGAADDLGGIWSRQTERRKVPGRIIETRAVVTEWRRPARLAVQRESGPVRPEAIYDLAASGSGTRLTFRLNVALAGARMLWTPLVLTLLHVLIKPVLPKDFLRLKELLAQA